MVANQAEIAVRGSAIDYRALGLIGILGSPMLLIEAGYRYLSGIPDNTGGAVVGIAGTIYIAGWMCSAVGMRRARVTGPGIGGLIVFLLQMAGLLLAALWSLNEIFHFVPAVENSAFGIADAAWPLSHLFMLIVGVAVLRTDAWRGWRMAAPFICGFALPLFFLCAAVGMKSCGIFIFTALTAAGFAMLGNAVRREAV